MNSIVILFMVILVCYIIAMFVYIHVKTPYSDICIRPGLQYNTSNTVVHEVPHDMIIEEIPKLLLLSRDTFHEMMDILKMTTRLMTTNEITFWAVDSTLLGAVRHNGFIPWSTDITFAIEHRNMGRLISLRTGIESYGYLLITTSSGYNIVARNASHFPILHIMMMSVRNSEVCICSPLTELNECSFNDTYVHRRKIFSVGDVFPLQSVTFEDVVINIPKNAEFCLDIMYPMGWQSIPYHATLWSKYNNMKSWSAFCRTAKLWQS